MTWKTETFERHGTTILNITLDDEPFPRGSIEFHEGEEDELQAWKNLIDQLNSGMDLPEKT